MTKTISTLKQFLIILCKIQESAWFRREAKWNLTNQAFRTYQAVSSKWWPITFNEIGYLFKSAHLSLDFAQNGKVLYLPPLEKNANFVPILSCECELTETKRIARFRVMLVGIDEICRIPHGIGFRMETPESMNQNANTTRNGGIHDFHHAQLIRKFEQRTLDTKLKICSPDWLPTDQPSFPLPANCPVKLLICLLLTLYGRKYCESLVTIGEMRQHLKELNGWIS